MKNFCDLYWRLDSTTKTNEKIQALETYFAVAQPSDAIWAIYFLSGNRIKRLVGTKLLRQWATEQANIAPWLFEECYDRVGDLAETISLILAAAKPQLADEKDSTRPTDLPLKTLIEDRLMPLRELEEEPQKEAVLELWQQFDQRQLFVLGKLMMGGFRVGVSKRLVIRALAKHTQLDAATITHRLMGHWEPTAEYFATLIDPDENETAISKPYPFFLANPLKNEPASLGVVDDWIAEWKWDGIRAQVIRRQGETFIWSRGEDLVTDQFPEVAHAASQLPDGTVIDGEILGWSETENRPLEFNQLQRRLGRKKVGKKLLTEVPVVLLAFDLIEFGGQDIRKLSIEERQKRLQSLLVRPPTPHPDAPPDLLKTESTAATKPTAIRLPPAVADQPVTDWETLSTARESSKQYRAEGLMLKRRGSAYQAGRPVGDWWKWKVEPYTVDAVLLYAQRGHGRRASLYTDFTFAVWKDDQLVPFAKAYSGLTDAELRKVDAFVRKNTKEKFGPVRSVTPELVFELAFENIQRSTRHKSGIAVRFPRISRWRHDKQPADADKLETILSMLE
jgi:DNA ligase-1